MTTFLGYDRADGRAGTRNHLLVLPTSSLSNRLAERVQQAVPAAACVTTMPDIQNLDFTTEVLHGLCTNPNVGEVLLIGVRESDEPGHGLAERVRASGTLATYLSIEGAGGTNSLHAMLVQHAQRSLATLDAVRRVPLPVGLLLLGTECGGSDAYSGLTANPALGKAADRLVGDGGSVLLCELPELIGAEHLLAKRAIDDKVAAAALRAVRAWEDTVIGFGEDLRGAQPSPGNQDGGLTTIEEKSLGGMSKGGSTPLVEVIEFGVAPTRSGLIMMDTPGNDIEQLTGMAAGGSNIVVFTTGRGTPTGSPLVPTLKVSTNEAMAAVLSDHMDLDAGPVASGAVSLHDMGDELYALIVATASGAPTCAERFGQRDFALPPRARGTGWAK